MTPETQAGLGSVAVLLYGLLWWGGAFGCAVLVTTSARSRRRQRLGTLDVGHTPTPHEARVEQLRRELAHASDHESLPLTGWVPADAADTPHETPARSGQAGPGPDRTPDPVGDLLVLAAGCSAATAGVHVAMAPLHAPDGVLHMAFFVVVGLVQAAQSARLLLRPTRPVLQVALLVNLAVVATWAASRTVGVLGTTEPVGSWDLAATLWELVVVVAAVRLLRRTVPPLRRPLLDPAAWSPYVAGVLGVSVLTLVLLPLGGH